VILGLIALAVLALPGQLLTVYYDHHCTTENEQPRKASLSKFVHDLLCDAGRQMKNS
jgi:hypothetical protein